MLFLSLTSMYVPSFTSIPLVLSKIWPGQATIMKKWLRGDNLVNIQGRMMVLVHCPSSHSCLSINQVLYQSILYFPRYETKFHLNPNSSFKVICRTRYRTDRQTDKEATICFHSLGSIKMHIKSTKRHIINTILIEKCTTTLH